MASGPNQTETLLQSLMGCVPNATPSLEDDYAPANPLQTALRTSFIVVNSLLVIVGNIFSMTVMRFVDSPRFPPSTKLFLCNVILWDLAYGISSVLYFAPAALNYWPYGEFVCVTSSFVILFINLCCVNAAILITVDRLLAVLHPLRHPIMISTKRALSIIAIAILFALSGNLTVFVNSPDIGYNNDAVMCFIRWSKASPDSLFRLIINNCCIQFIPVVILVGCYTKLYLVARKHARRLAELRTNSFGSGTNPASTVANIRGLRMCLLITATFCIAWSPYTVVCTLDYVAKQDSPPWLEFIACWMCLCNSWWNVIIYFFMAQEFRKTAHKLLCRIQL